MFKRLSVVFIGLLLPSCNEGNEETDESFKIAFMADVHLQDIYGSFSDNKYRGVLNPVEGIWFLAIDANVYVPKDENTFSSASIGYNNVLTDKNTSF